MSVPRSSGASLLHVNPWGRGVRPHGYTWSNDAHPLLRIRLGIIITSFTPAPHEVSVSSFFGMTSRVAFSKRLSACTHFLFLCQRNRVSFTRLLGHGYVVTSPVDFAVFEKIKTVGPISVAISIEETLNAASPYACSVDTLDICPPRIPYVYTHTE